MSLMAELGEGPLPEPKVQPRPPPPVEPNRPPPPQLTATPRPPPPMQVCSGSQLTFYGDAEWQLNIFVSIALWTKNILQMFLCLKHFLHMIDYKQIVEECYEKLTAFSPVGNHY